MSAQCVPCSLPPSQRCDARVWNRGFGGQCSKECADGSPLCGIHQAQLEKILESRGTDLRLGRWSQERPNFTLDGKRDPIKWKDSKTPRPSNGYPEPRGPAPKSNCGGKKVWNGVIGQWEEPTSSS